MDHDRNRRRYGKSDEELVELFANALGVRAQNLDSGGGAFDSDALHAMMLQSSSRGTMARHDGIRSTLERVEVEHRRVLVAVYTPHGAPTWLLDAFAPAWGGGSYIRLAASLPRATLAAADRKPGTTVVDWMATRGRGDSPLFRNLRDDAEALRLAALAAYDVVRVERVRADQERDRAAKVARDERNRKLYLELTARSRTRRSSRFEARLKSGRVA